MARNTVGGKTLSSFLGMLLLFDLSKDAYYFTCLQILDQHQSVLQIVQIDVA